MYVSFVFSSRCLVRRARRTIRVYARNAGRSNEFPVVTVIALLGWHTDDSFQRQIYDHKLLDVRIRVAFYRPLVIDVTYRDKSVARKLSCLVTTLVFRRHWFLARVAKRKTFARLWRYFAVSYFSKKVSSLALRWKYYFCSIVRKYLFRRSDQRTYRDVSFRRTYAHCCATCTNYEQTERRTLFVIEE